MKLFRVDEPLTERFVPEMLPVDDMFPPLMFVAERLVEDAVDAKKLVVVAEVPVAVVKVNDWRVEDPVARRLDELNVPERARLPP